MKHAHRLARGKRRSLSLLVCHHVTPDVHVIQERAREIIAGEKTHGPPMRRICACALRVGLCEPARVVRTTLMTPSRQAVGGRSSRNVQSSETST